MTRAIFGHLPDGAAVEQVTISGGGLTARVLSYGSVLQDLRLAGIERSLTLGSDRLSDYETTMPYHGSLIGPIANRISTARVRIDGMMYELERNQSGRIHLHSGAQATQYRVWQVQDHGPDFATLTCTLPDGAAGLPGHRLMTAAFRLIDDSLSLRITGTSRPPSTSTFTAMPT